MASKMRVEQQFDCSAKSLFELLSSEEFDEQLMKAVSVGREVLSRDEDESGVRLRLKLSPEVSMPGFVSKLVGDRNDYVEERNWDRKSLSSKWSIQPGMSADKVNINGTVTCKDLGNGRSARIIEGTFEVKVALIGGKIEKFIIGQTEESFKKGEAFIRDYIKKNDVH